MSRETPARRAPRRPAATDAIDALVSARRLETEADYEEFERALGRLPVPLDRSSLDRLFHVFDDETADPQWMYEIIHRIEQVPRPDLEDALVTGLPRLRDQAPDWAEVLVMRALNDDAARAQLLLRANRGSRAEQDALVTVLRTVSTYPQAVGGYARELQEQMGDGVGDSVPEVRAEAADSPCDAPRGQNV